MVKVGDEVVTKSPLWHHGENVGDRLGRVISTRGHVIVELYNYNDNPIRCFQNDVEVVNRDDDTNELFDDDQLDLFFGSFGKP